MFSLTFRNVKVYLKDLIKAHGVCVPLQKAKKFEILTVVH